jgi:hypothetical protein
MKIIWNKKQRMLVARLNVILQTMTNADFEIDINDIVCCIDPETKKTIVSISDLSLPKRYIDIIGKSECDFEDEYSVNKGIHIAKISFLKKLNDQVKVDMLNYFRKLCIKHDNFLDEMMDTQDDLKSMLSNF